MRTFSPFGLFGLQNGRLRVLTALKMQSQRLLEICQLLDILSLNHCSGTLPGARRNQEMMIEQNYFLEELRTPFSSRAVWEKLSEKTVCKRLLRSPCNKKYLMKESQGGKFFGFGLDSLEFASIPLDQKTGTRRLNDQ